MVDTITPYDREAAISSLREILLKSSVCSNGKYYTGLILDSFEIILAAENLFYDNIMLVTKRQGCESSIQVIDYECLQTLFDQGWMISINYL